MAASPTTAPELLEAVHAANRLIVDSMSEENGSVGMGSTLAAALLSSSGVVVVNVGDSPVLELIDGRLVQLSTDDVPAGHGGVIGLASTQVTQTLGGSAGLVELHPHVYEDRLGPQRTLLLCSDGLTSFVARADVAEVLSQSDSGSAGEVLIGLALEAGAPDNVTCVVVMGSE